MPAPAPDTSDREPQGSFTPPPGGFPAAGGGGRAGGHAHASLLSPHASLLLSLCRAFEAAPRPGAMPEWLLLAAPGDNDGRDGRQAILDDPQPAVEAFRAEAVDLPVDIEHATHLRGPAGLDAPAVGWVTALEARDAGLWGRIDWTPKGTERVLAREYRYYSPAYWLDAAGRIVGIASVGLTNKPNMRLPALNRAGAHPPATTAGTPGQEPAMAVPPPILEALGAAPETTPEAAAAAIRTLKSDRDLALHRAQTPDLTLFVPRADHDAALHRAQAAETALREARAAERDKAIEALLTQALADARVTPATLEYHRAQARTEGGIERLTAYLGAAPAVLTPETRTGTPPGGTLQLNAEQARIAAAFGHTAETLAKYEVAK